MIYSYSYEILPTDTVDNPVVGHIKLNSGFIRRVQVSFPVVCAFAVKCCIYNDSRQLIPTNQDGVLCHDGGTFDVPMWYDIDNQGNDLYFVGWGDDLDYSHSVYLSIDVKESTEPDILLVQSRVIDLLEHLINVIKGIL